MNNQETRVVRAALTDVGTFSRVLAPERRLRSYQEPLVRAVVESVRHGLGMEFAAVFSRQAGKDEMLAQLCAYLLCLYQKRGGNIVVALPTLRPQGVITRDRLLERLDHPLLHGLVNV